jgi:hypothetical protein
LHPEVLKQIGIEGGYADKELAEIENHINFYKKEFAGGFPVDKPEIKAEFDELLRKRDLKALER